MPAGLMDLWEAVHRKGEVIVSMKERFCEVSDGKAEAIGGHRRP